MFHLHPIALVSIVLAFVRIALGVALHMAGPETWGYDPGDDVMRVSRG